MTNVVDGRYRPVPVADELSQPFWDAAREHRLVIQRCQECRRFQHPPAAACPTCESTELAFEQVSGKATVYAFTVIHDTRIAALADSTPFVVAFVDLIEQENLRLTCNLSGAPVDEISHGAPASVTFLDLENDVSIPEFVLDE